MKFTQGISIDGILYDIPLVSIKRTADFLDKYAERTEDEELKRELIGVYYNYQMSWTDRFRGCYRCSISQNRNPEVYRPSGAIFH